VAGVSGTLENALLVNTVTNAFVSVQFNPEDYTVNREVQYAQIGVPGLSAPVVQFVHGNAQTLEMELFVDTLEKSSQAEAGSDVRELVKKITSLMDIEPTVHAPPPVLFTWGSLSFSCVLQRASQKFIMFKPDGTPVRAKVQVTFSEFCNVELEAKEVKRQTADYSKLHTVCAGDSLALIAWREYGYPTAWRPIALRNGIDDPRRLRTGDVLVLPRLPYRDRDTGTLYYAGAIA
jgi:nucleoid-associated protein YgaU